MIKIDFSDIKKVLDKNLGKFGLEKYEYIMNAVQQGDVSQNLDFQRVFDGFYKVRRNAAWRKVFFDLFEEVRKNAPAVAGDPAASFDKVITALRQATGNVEMSFSSKLLASVNKDYYNVARVDGTSKWRIFYKITLPMISPSLFYLVITGFIGAFKAYSDVVALFGTDLNAAGMNTIVGYVYDMLYGNSGGYPSFASAAALILFAIVMTITMINLLVSKENVHYQ